MSAWDTRLSSDYRRWTEGNEPTDRCPEVELFERVLAGDPTPEERRRVVEHLGECARCTAFVQELRELRGWAERAAEAGGGGKLLRFPRPVWLPALAATLALVVAGGWMISRWQGRPTIDPEVLRGAPADVVPAPGSRLSEVPGRFDWPDEPGAVHYRLELFDAAAETLWRSEPLAASDCALPTEVAAQLVSGESFSWQVSIAGPVRRARLGPFWFTVDGGG